MPARLILDLRILACCLGLLLPHAAWAETWLAGVAKVKITPTSPMPMAGYASRGSAHATETLNDLWAKALVLQDPQGHSGVLVTLDLCGIDRPLAQRAVRSIAAATDYERDQIILSVSHTHSGPVVAGNLRPMHYMIFDAQDRQRVDAYANRLVEQITECVLAAQRELRPAQLSHGQGQASFAVNRRNNPEAEVPQRRQAGELVGPTDHDVPVLAVRQGDQLAAVVFGYACHCTTLSGMQWSSDYAGFAQAQLEADHPGCTAMFWAGCGADQNPIPRRTVELAKDYGQQLAAAVSHVLSSDLQPLSPALQTSYREIELPFDTLPTDAQLESDTQSKNVYVASRAQHLLEQVRQGQPLAPSYPYPIACWQLGNDLQWISLGGEVVVDYALAIKSLTPDTPTWVMAYAHDVMAYIPSRRVLAEGGYEGGGAMIYYGLPASWSPEIERLIMDEVGSQLKH